MDIIKLAHKERNEMMKEYRKIKHFSLSLEAFEHLQLAHREMFGGTMPDNVELFGTPVIVNPFQTKPVVALQKAVDEWLYRRGQ